MMTEEEMLARVAGSRFGTVVTKREDGLASRTMLIAWTPDQEVFLLTKRTANKIQEIDRDANGLIHVGKIADELSQSFDISITGRYHRVGPSDPAYARGIAALAQKNRMIREIADSEARDDYVLLRFDIQSLHGWTYQQAASGQPKTSIAVRSGMIETAFSRIALKRLVSMLEQTRSNVDKPEATSQIDDLRGLIVEHLESEKATHPYTLKQLPAIVERLACVPKSDCKEICEYLCQSCRECMLHVDSCFINVIYIAFRSVELGRYLEPSKVRPSLRTDA